MVDKQDPRSTNRLHSSFCTGLRNNDLYTTLEALMTTTVDPEPRKICDKCEELPVKSNEPAVATIYQAKGICFFCGFPNHSRDCYPAHVATCKNTQRKDITHVHVGPNLHYQQWLVPIY